MKEYEPYKDEKEFIKNRFILSKLSPLVGEGVLLFLR